MLNTPCGLVAQASRDLNGKDNWVESEYETLFDSDKGNRLTKVSMLVRGEELGDEGEIPLESESDDEDSIDESDYYNVKGSCCLIFKAALRTASQLGSET